MYTQLTYTRKKRISSGYSLSFTVTRWPYSQIISKRSTDNNSNNNNKPAAKVNCIHFQVSLQSTIVANAPLFRSVFMLHIIRIIRLVYSRIWSRCFLTVHRVGVSVLVCVCMRVCACVFFFLFCFVFGAARLVGRLAHRLWSMYYLCVFEYVVLCRLCMRCELLHF